MMVMMMNRQYIVIGLVSVSLILGTSILGASFNSPETLINVPMAKSYDTGDLDFSVATGINSIKKYQFDLSLNYSLNEYFKGGITMVNYEKAVINLQALLINSEKFGGLKITGGILNISSESQLSTWDNESSVNSNNLYHFLVGSRNLFSGRIHLGIAKRRQSGMPSLYNGVLLGFNKELKKFNLIFEFDGTAANFGIERVSPYKDTFMKLAFSAPITTADNDDTQNLISVQIIRRTNVFKRYSDSLNTLEEEYANFKVLEEDFQTMKLELEDEINDLKVNKELLAKEVEKLQSRRLGEFEDLETRELTEDEAFVQGYTKDIQALMYYQQAEEFFKKQDFYKSIQQLELAIDLSPKEPQFYFILGSIYYKLKNEKKAYKSWAKAYELDPTSRKFSKLPPVVKAEILKEVKRRELKKKGGKDK